MKNKFFILCLAAIIVNTTAVFAEQNPCYSSKARTTDQGMQSDYIYTFPDGAINPPDGEPILMLNGEFTSKAVIVLRDGHSLAPLRFIAEAFGAGVAWDGGAQKVTLITNESIIELVIGQNTVFVNGGEVTLDAVPVIINDSTYVPLRFVSEQLNKTVGFLPGVRSGIGLAYNPVVWIDDYAAAPDEDVLLSLKARFTEGMESSKQSNVGGVFETALNNVLPKVAEDIENTVYIGQAGRYAVYKGPYITLVEPGADGIYFYKYGNGFGGIYKADFTDPELFWSDYIRG